ncbi:MAG: hypothetical protein PHG75_02765 [Syntrophomonas sp.]|nr:hypothetical protein [Syntrophomonas sp.]
MDIILNDSNRVDLAEVYRCFEQALQPWWDELRDYVPPVGEDIGFEILPIMVLNAYNWAGNTKRQAIQMTSLFRTINFANLVHLKVRDGEEGQKHDQVLQFTILIGDYIFGRVLKLLLETGAERLLDQFAAMIGTLNEGFVLQYSLEAEMETYVSRSRAPLYTNAFSSAARMQGWDSSLVSLYGDLGTNLGMALEMKYAYHQPERGCFYLQQAEARYGQLHQNGIFLSDELGRIFQAING